MSEYKETAKEVAGKAIGRDGLLYITIIVLVGVGSSIVLEADKIAAVMGLLGASLTALISMLANVAGATDKEEKPEFEVIKSLIAREEQPMKVDVEGDHVTVTKGENVVKTKKAPAAPVASAPKKKLRILK